MKSAEQNHIERAIAILADNQQTSFAKAVAKNLLRDVGFSEQEIKGFYNSNITPDRLFVMAA